MNIVTDIIKNIIGSGVVVSKKTWLTIMTYVSMALISLFNVGITETTQVVTVAAVTTILVFIGLEDFLIGKIPYIEIERRLRDLVGRREVVVLVVGAVVLWIQDLYGVTWSDTTIAAVVTLWLALVGSQSAKTVGDNYAEAKQLGTTHG